VVAGLLEDWHAVAAEIDTLLRKAIEEKRLVELIYNEKRRIVEPHDYGVQNGSIKLLGYQLSGASSGPLPNWRWFEVDLITDIRLLDRRFPGGRGGGPGSSGNHNQWDELFLRVEPADGAD
jgi:predicted DNA-binding transcriptional regulator YafY